MNHIFPCRYQLGDNEIFRGQTYKLIEDTRFMFGKDNNVFWVKLTNQDYEKAQKKPLSKSVRLGERRFFSSVLSHFLNEI